MLELLIDFWSFVKMRKRFWLFPIVFIMLLLGALLFFSQGSVLAPFIYTIF